MKTIFLETNAINQCIKNNITGCQLSNILKIKNQTPIISLHTTYELVRTFLNKASEEKGMQLFSFIKELNPIFTCETKMLLKREISKLKGLSNSVSYFIEQNHILTLNRAIDNLCQGIILDEYKKYVSDMEDLFHEENKMWDRIIKKNKTINTRIKFFDFVSELLKYDKELIDQILIFTDTKLDKKYIYKFKNRISSYPALRTLLYSNAYLNFIAKNTKNKPSKDKADDFRHLIDSSYCTTFVSNDRKLKRYASEINPDIEFITLEQLLKS